MKTVNFLDAINSGKRFRIVHDCGKSSNWYYVEGGVVRNWDGTPMHCYLPTLNAQLELEERKVTITESEFDEAMARANNLYSYGEPLTRNIKKELGF